MDDLQSAVRADALASQRAGLWRLVTLGVPLLAVLGLGAFLGLDALASLVTYQERVSERIKKLKLKERKYKSLLLTWAPLSAWLASVETDDEA